MSKSPSSSSDAAASSSDAPSKKNSSSLASSEQTQANNVEMIEDKGPSSTSNGEGKVIKRRKKKSQSPNIRERPKRSSSQHVDYNLKKSKIIINFDNDLNERKKKRRRELLLLKQQYQNNNNSRNNNNDTHLISGDPNNNESSPTKSKELFIRDSNDNIIGMNEINSGDNNNNNNNNNNNSMTTTNKNNNSNEGNNKSNTPIINDIINGATGLPLSQFPTEKIKRERLWNYKKISLKESHNNNSNINNGNLNTVLLMASPVSAYSSNDSSLSDITALASLSASPSNSTPDNNNSINNNNATDIESRLYKSNLRTHDSDMLTKLSSLRHVLKDKNNENNNPIDIEEDMNHSIANNNNHNIHVKSKPLISKNKLFNRSSFNSTDENDKKEKHSNNTIDEDIDLENIIENEDFCSSCGQTGSFLCCDTCPRSFHFLCLDPPIDPNNLPEGDWSCSHCLFKAKYPNIIQYKKSEKKFIRERIESKKNKLFSKVLFQINGFNPKQFNLPNSIKETFQNIKVNQRDQYEDDKAKLPLTERQLFNTPYGQSITKLDSYCPDNHYVNPDSGDKFLICYKCKTTRFGSWDHPEDSRLLIKCDYCETPWHLDCIPNVPRASLKNLGFKWKCPLHANSQINRRLNRKQKFIKPLQNCGFKNNGDIEIILDEINSVKTKENVNKIGKLKPIPKINESSIKLDFIDKIYRYKQIERRNNIKLQENLIDKIISSRESNAEVNDISSLLYFKYCNRNSRNSLKKIWDFKEICQFANNELKKSKKVLKKEFENGKINEKGIPLASEESNNIGKHNNILLSSKEINELLFIKRVIESKSKNEVEKFFGIDN